MKYLMTSSVELTKNNAPALLVRLIFLVDTKNVVWGQDDTTNSGCLFVAGIHMDRKGGMEW